MLKRQIGDKGEAAAVRFLKKNGYKIIEQNYLVPFGEIDIIAKDKEYLCFVEVKMRKSDAFGAPAEFVHAKKRLRIIKAAQSYIKSKAIDDTPMRFDVVAIVGDGERDSYKNLKIEVIKNAFTLSGI